MIVRKLSGFMCDKSAFKRPMSKCLAFAVLVIASAETHARASDCLAQAETELEQAYCNILAEDSLIRLPPFGEFKRNPPSTQRLLLKRPAKKVGIELPELEVKKSAKVTAKEKAKAKVQTKINNTSSIQKESQKTPIDNTADLGLSECQFDKDSITCHGRAYHLLANKPNKEIAEAAFSEDNQLGFPEPPGAGASQREKNHYLADCYERYLARMQSIGLAGSTMSYTRFYYIHEDIKKQGLDFSERFATMFNFLKKDKAQMAVKDRYGEKHPKGLQDCMRLSKQYIVCDNKKSNWVYWRAPLLAEN